MASLILVLIQAAKLDILAEFEVFFLGPIF